MSHVRNNSVCSPLDLHVKCQVSIEGRCEKTYRDFTDLVVIFQFRMGFKQFVLQSNLHDLLTSDYITKTLQEMLVMSCSFQEFSLMV